MKCWTKLAIPLLCSGMIFFTGYKNVENKKQEIKSIVEVLKTEEYLKDRWERKWKRPTDVLKEKIASADDILKKHGLLRTFYKKDLKSLETTVGKTLSKEYANKLITSATYHLDYPEDSFLVERAEKELGIALWIYEKLNMPEEETNILKWASFSRRNLGGKLTYDKRRDYARGVLYFREGKKMTEDCSYLDAPYLLKKAYDHFTMTRKCTFGFQESPYILEQSKKFKEDIKKLWPKAHYSAGKYLYNEGYFNQAEKSFVNAQKLGYDVSEDLKKVRHDIKNRPEKNKNRTNWIVGSAGTTITLSDGKGTIEFHDNKNLKE